MTNKTTKEAFNLIDMAVGETPAALRAGLGGALGGLAVKYLPKERTTTNMALHSIAPLVGLGIGGVEGALGAAAPILMKKDNLLGASLMGSAIGQASTLAPVIVNPSLESAPEALATMAGSAFLARTGNKFDDIVKSIASHKELKNDILPSMALSMPKAGMERALEESRNKIYEEAIPGGKHLAAAMSKYKNNRYIDKELKEVERLLKEPGENYKIGHVKEAFLPGLGEHVAKTLGGVGRSLASGIGTAYNAAGRGLGTAYNAAGRGLGTAYNAAGRGLQATGRGLGEGWKATKDVASAIGSEAKSMVQPLKDAGNATWDASKRFATATGNKAIDARQATSKFMQNNPGTSSSYLGTAAGALAGGMSGYEASDQIEGQSGFGRAVGALGGAAAGALGGRALARGAHMAIGTNYGRALKQQAASRLQSGQQMGLGQYARQAVGGFTQGAGAQARAAAVAAPRQHAKDISSSLGDIKTTLTKDVGRGGYGLNSPQANEVGTAINKRINESNWGMANSLAGGYGGIGKTMGYSAVGGISGAAGGYANAEEDDKLLGAVAGGLAGAGLGAAAGRYGSTAMKSLNFKSNLQKQYLDRIKSDPRFLEAEVHAGRISPTGKATSNALKANIAKANTGISQKPNQGFFSVGESGSLGYTAGSSSGTLNMTDDVAKGLGAKDTKSVTDSINNAMSGIDANTQKRVTEYLNKGGPESAELSKALTEHANDIVNVTNKTHSDVASMISQVVGNSAKNTGLGTAAYGANVEYLMSRPSIKDLANKLNAGAKPTPAEIRTALSEAGVPANQLDSISNTLKAGLDDIGDAATKELASAKSALTNRLETNVQNIGSKSYAKSVESLESEFTRAASKNIPQRDLDVLKGELDDIVNMHRQMGNNDEAQEAISLAKQTLAKGGISPTDVRTLSAKLRDDARILKSSNLGQLGAFERYSNQGTEAANKLLKNVDDDFSRNVISRLDTSNKAQFAKLKPAVESITNGSNEMKKAVSTGEVNHIKDFNDLSNLSRAINGKSNIPAIPTGGPTGASSYNAIYTTGKEDLTSLQSILNKAPGKGRAHTDVNPVLSKLQQNGIDNAELDKIRALPADQQVTATNNLLKEIKRLTGEFDASVKRDMGTFKQELANSMSASGSFAGSAKLKGFGSISQTQADEETLRRVNQTATEAPVVKEVSHSAAPVQTQASQTAAPVSQEAQAMQQQAYYPMQPQQMYYPQQNPAYRQYGMIPYGVGAVGVGGAGLAGYQYLSAPVQQAAQLSQAPVQNAMSYTQPAVQNMYNPNYGR